MNSPEFHIVHVPSDTSDEMKEKIETIRQLTQPEITFWAAVRVLASRALHVLRIHTWTEYRTYDETLNRIIVHPNAHVCLFCSRGRFR